MNIKVLLSALALTAVFAAPAMAASFSFNRADADRMVNFAKEEGISLPKDVAESIVKYRGEGHQFLTEDDLSKDPPAAHDSQPRRNRNRSALQS